MDNLISIEQTQTEHIISDKINDYKTGFNKQPFFMSDISHNVIFEQKPTHIKIDKLLKYNLSNPLLFTLEPDDDGFIAKCPDLPTLYGYGDDQAEAINNLKFEIDSLYDDLMEDDNFTNDWLKIKFFLQKKIIR